MDIEWKQPEELEHLALSIIKKHQPQALITPKAIAILDLIECAREKFGYTFEAAVLPILGGQKALGCVDNKNKKILLDVNLLSQAGNSNMWTFVAAHELGHLVLHRQYFENDQTPYDSVEIENEFPVNKRLEWQANRFASELLLPRDMVKCIVNAESDKMGITRNFGKIYIDGKDYNYRTLNDICSAVSSTFVVTKKVAQIRLQELGLIIDDREYHRIFH